MALLVLSLVAGPGCPAGPDGDTGDDLACEDHDGDSYFAGDQCPDDIAQDCDDGDPAIHPGVEETCDGVDQDCDGYADEGLAQTWYADADGDGYGDPLAPVTACIQPGGTLEDHDDCDDSDPAIHPGAGETMCDGIDTDCDGIGEDVVATTGDAEYDDLQAAIDEAPDGDIVSICPGIHEQHGILDAGRTLTLTSWSGTPDDTALDGRWKYRLIEARCGSHLTVTHLSLLNGRAQEVEYAVQGTYGGAIAAIGADLVVDDCVFEGNRGADILHNIDSGAAISLLVIHVDQCALQPSLMVSSSSFSNNTGHAGTAIAAMAATDVVIEDTVFSANEADEDGGAINADAINVQIDDCTFTSNTAMSEGGGIRVSAEDVVIDGCVFTSNAAHGGGGLSIHGDTRHLTLTESTFQYNGSNSGGGALDMRTDDLEATIEGCSFEENQSHEGGAMAIDGEFMDLDIAGCTFEGNDASYGGGGVDVDSLASDIEFTDCVFQSNTSTTSGGGALALRVDDVSLSMTRCRFTGNTSFRGGVIELTDDATVFDPAVPSSITASDCEFDGNERAFYLDHTGSFSLVSSSITSSLSGAALLQSAAATLVSDDCDWGEDAADNDEYDVAVGVTLYTGFGAGSSFTCTTAAGCL